jgi:hypothetical protein
VMRSYVLFPIHKTEQFCVLVYHESFFFSKSEEKERLALIVVLSSEGHGSRFSQKRLP